MRLGLILQGRGADAKVSRVQKGQSGIIDEIPMILTGRVIEVKAGKSSSEHEFVTFALSPGPGRSSANLTIPNDEGWELDDAVEVSISMGSANGVAVDKRNKKQKAS